MSRGPRNVQTPGGQPQPESPASDGGRPMTLGEIAAAEGADPAIFDETTDDEAYRERARTLRAKDVDATRLKRSVLTLDGWVCPATVPAPAVKQ